MGLLKLPADIEIFKVDEVGPCRETTSGNTSVSSPLGRDDPRRWFDSE